MDTEVILGLHKDYNPLPQKFTPFSVQLRVCCYAHPYRVVIRRRNLQGLCFWVCPGFSGVIKSLKRTSRASLCRTPFSVLSLFGH